jgi:predicted transcriptional regulator
MESNLLELAADIVTTHASNKEITLDQLMDEIKKVYAKLKGIEQGDALETGVNPSRGTDQGQTIRVS